MAKGVEDTAFYRWTRFIALNEVGGDPAQFGVAADEFHARRRRRQDRWPDGMTTLSTHDTKRGEDVRARIAVLAELPDDWARGGRRLVDRGPAARPGVRQPALADRRRRLADRAGPAARLRREGGARGAATARRWTDPDESFERAVHAVVDAATTTRRCGRRSTAFVARITPPGWSNSLPPSWSS